MSRLITTALLALPILVAACSEQGSTSPPAARQPVPAESSQAKNRVAAQDVKREATEAVDTTSDYLAQQKREFIAKAEHDLADLGTAMEDLRTRAQGATAETKAKMDEALRNLERERTQTQQKLSDLKSASANAWQDAKAGFQSALERLRQSYEKVKQDFA